MGVKIDYGANAGVFPHGENARQLPYMVKYGMTPMQAIRSATNDAADLLGWRKDAGSIAPGKYADIIAFDADPLADIAALAGAKIVMKGGEIVD
jgi:imidazolonepropionase-like amidohydrolase